MRRETYAARYKLNFASRHGPARFATDRTSCCIPAPVRPIRDLRICPSIHSQTTFRDTSKLFHLPEPDPPRRISNFLDFLEISVTPDLFTQFWSGAIVIPTSRTEANPQMANGSQQEEIIVIRNMPAGPHISVYQNLRPSARVTYGSYMIQTEEAVPWNIGRVQCPLQTFTMFVHWSEQNFCITCTMTTSRRDCRDRMCWEDPTAYHYKRNQMHETSKRLVGLTLRIQTLRSKDDLLRLFGAAKPQWHSQSFCSKTALHRFFDTIVQTLPGIINTLIPVGAISPASSFQRPGQSPRSLSLKVRPLLAERGPPPSPALSES